jgi:hypothetical protein
MINLNKSSAALLLLLPVSMVSLAADTKTVPEFKQGTEMHQSMGVIDMMGMSEDQKDIQLRKLQEHHLMMHDLSNQIFAEKDPAKKEQLKNQQLQIMKAHHAQMMGNRQQMKQKHHQQMKKSETEAK